MRFVAPLLIVWAFSAPAWAMELVAGDVVSRSRQIAGKIYLLHIDPATGEQTLFPSNREPIEASLQAIDHDPDGNLFFVRAFSGNHLPGLYRLDRNSGEVELVASELITSALAVDSEGRAIVATREGDLSVKRIDPISGTVESIITLDALRVQGWGVLRLAVDADGEIFTVIYSTAGRAELVAIDPVTKQTRLVTPLPSHTGLIAVEPSGDILYAGNNGFPGVVRIDPSTGSQLASFAVGWQFTGLSVHEAAGIYAEAFQSGTGPRLFRIDPLNGAITQIAEGFLLSGSLMTVIPGELPACRDLMDNDGDGLFDAPEDPGCEDSSEATEVEDSPFDLCSMDLDACSNDLEFVEQELLTCEGDLLICQVELGQVTADTDADGVPDLVDRCPSTAASSVDLAGCSQAEFCAAFDVSTGHGRTACRRADWMNNDPLGNTNDCEVARSECVAIP